MVLCACVCVSSLPGGGLTEHSLLFAAMLASRAISYADRPSVDTAAAAFDSAASAAGSVSTSPAAAVAVTAADRRGLCRCVTVLLCPFRNVLQCTSSTWHARQQKQTSSRDAIPHSTPLELLCSTCSPFRRGYRAAASVGRVRTFLQ